MFAPNLNYYHTYYKMHESKGFIRTGTGTHQKISSEQKVQLLRKGNELFNAGQVVLAEKIFITLAYTDGLTRLGDYYYKKSDYKKAAELYLKAPDPKRLAKVCSRMAQVVRLLMTDGPGVASKVVAQKEGNA